MVKLDILILIPNVSALFWSAWTLRLGLVLVWIYQMKWNYAIQDLRHNCVGNHLGPTKATFTPFVILIHITQSVVLEREYF